MTVVDVNSWAARAIRRLHAEGGGAQTPLRRLPLPAGWHVEVYLKDESAHPTGTVKHRLVRALYCHAIASGRIGPETEVVTGTGGPVAVAGAYFARLLGLSFTAVLPARTPAAVRDGVERYGGRWHTAEQPPAALQREAAQVAEGLGGHALDHFADAAQAVLGCGAPTVADEIFDQLRGTGHPVPRWIVTGAGTGATSATTGRHLRRHGYDARLAVVDPEGSAYFPGWTLGRRDYTTGLPSRIPGIGRPRVEPAFEPGVVDLVIPVPDAASPAAVRWLARTAGLAAGPATGTVLWGLCHLVAGLVERGTPGSVVAVAGDGARPDDTVPAARSHAPDPYEAALDRFLSTARSPVVDGGVG